MSKPQPLNISVERYIDAPPAQVYDLISDVTRMGEWSPECTEASWLGGATAPAEGVRFKGKNKLGFATWSTKPTITQADRGEVFEFKVPKDYGPLWRYEFHAEGTGTRVVESMHQAKPLGGFIRFLQRRNGVHDRHAHLADGMRTTLDRVAAAANQSVSA